MDAIDCRDDTSNPYRTPRARLLDSGRTLSRWFFGPQRYRAVPWTAWEVAMLAPMVISGVWRGVNIRFELPESYVFAAFNQLALMSVILLPFIIVMLRGARLYQVAIHMSRLGRNALAGFLTYFIAAPAVTLTYFCALLFFQRMPHGIERTLTNSPTILNITVAAVAAVIVAPLLEELVFRGILLPWLRHWVGPWRAIVLNSSIFAIAHFDAWPAPIPLFVL